MEEGAVAGGADFKGDGEAGCAQHVKEDEMDVERGKKDERNGSDIGPGQDRKRFR